MRNSNMFEAKADLSQLIKILENKEEDVIYIAQNGVKVAQLTLLPKAKKARRIGVAKGKFTVPDDKAFDDMDKGSRTFLRVICDIDPPRSNKERGGILYRFAML